jgi:hypothetical protein
MDTGIYFKAKIEKNEIESIPGHKHEAEQS